ncbi:MAG: LruC domain-containing protein [Candidatus Cloacimonadales bacterium]
MKNSMIMILIILSLLGCDLLEEKNPSSKDMMDELAISEQFGYETVQEVEVKITFLDNGNLPVPHIFFRVMDKPAASGGKILARGATNQAGEYKTVLNLPTSLDSLTVMGFMRTQTLPIENNQVEWQIGGVSQRSVRVGVDTSRDGFEYVTEFDANGIPIDMQTDYISSDFLQRVDASLPERYPVSDYHPDYLQAGSMLNTVVEADAEVWITFVQEGAGYQNSLGYYTYSLDSGAPADPAELEHNIIFPNVSIFPDGMHSGDKVYLGSFEAGTVIGWFLVANGWNYGSVSETRTRYYSNSDYNPEPDPAHQQHVVLLHDEESGKFLLGFEDLRRPEGDDDFNDAVFYVTSNPIEAISTENVNPLDIVQDSDNDGISDLYDDYPDDPQRAFDNYYPAEDSWGTLAFEDYWPRQGDYDMNDLVLGYNFQTIHTPNNRLIDIIGQIKVRAIGAAYHNGFALELPVDPSNIADLAGQVDFEYDNPLLIVNIFDDAYDIMNPPGSGFVNTEESMEYFSPQSVSFGLTLQTPLVLEDLAYQLPYNPFLRINGDISKEIHLPDYPPTSKADLSLFGTEDDNSSPAAGRFYKSNNNLPWALNIPLQWQYPQERKEITWAYRNFAEWAESSGTLQQNWYHNLPENIDESYIYLP